MKRIFRVITMLLVTSMASCSEPASTGTLADRDARLLDETFAAMPAQRPGQPDLYVLGVAGDGHEDVFRNEIAYLETLATKRLGAGGRVVTLVNHADSLGARPRPLATLDNLRSALKRIGAAMDPAEDFLLLFMTTHGTEEHELILQLFPVVESVIHPLDLRDALDESGIRLRVVVVSACYSGGFLPALRDRDTLAISAASADRTSFGCGGASHVTDFGRAFLVEGLNRHSDFVAAFEHAASRIDHWEREDGLESSQPQIQPGAGIVQILPSWQATLPRAATVPYPYGLP